MSYAALLAYPLFSAVSIMMARVGLLELKERSWRRGFLILAAGSVIFAIGLACFGFALVDLPVSAAVLVGLPLNIVLTVLLGTMLLREGMQVRKALGIALIVAGTVVVLSKV